MKILKAAGNRAHGVHAFPLGPALRRNYRGALMPDREALRRKNKSQAYGNLLVKITL